MRADYLSTLLLAILLSSLIVPFVGESSADTTVVPLGKIEDPKGYILPETGSDAPRTNETLWRYRSIESICGTPVVADGLVYTITDNGFVSAVDPNTAKCVWSYDLVDSFSSGLTVSDGVVYAASISGYVYALIGAPEVSGSRLLWSYCFEYEDTCACFESSPTVVDGVVYVASVHGYLGINDGNLFALTYNEEQEEVNEIWIYSPSGALYSSPIVVDDIVYISSENGVYALPALTEGWPLWHYITNGPVKGSPTVVDGVVYVACDDGYVYALNAGTSNSFGEELLVL